MYAGSIVNIHEYNLNRSFTAVGYIKINDGDADLFIYSEASTERNVSFVAKSAYDDVSVTYVKDKYEHLITDHADTHNGKYSPYT